MKISKIFITICILIAIVAITLGIANRLKWESEQVYCYNNNKFSRQVSNVSIIEESDYSCELINYAISNDLKVVYSETNMTTTNYRNCYTVYGDYRLINQTEISRNNYTDYTYYTKAELGEYYLNNCFEDVKSQQDEVSNG